MSEEQKTVTVTAAQIHTHEGKQYQPGDTYEIEAEYAESVEAQGKAFRVAKLQAHVKKESHPVTPMTSDDIPTPKKHK